MIDYICVCVCVCVFPALLGCFIHCFVVPCIICKFSFLKKKLISNTHEKNEKKNAHNTKQASLVHTKSSYPLTSGHSIVQACAKEGISLDMRLKHRLPWHVIMGLR